MAKKNIVGGLFGLSSDEIRRQQQATDTVEALNFGQLMPQGYGAIGAGFSKLGAGAIRAGSSMLGLEDETLMKAKDIEQIIKETQSDSPTGTPPAAIYNKLYEKLSAKGYTNESMMALQKAQEAAIASEELDIKAAYYGDLKQKAVDANVLKIEKEIQDGLEKARSDNKTLLNQSYQMFDPLKPYGQALANFAERNDISDKKGLNSQALQIFNEFAGATAETKYGTVPLYTPSEAWTETQNFLNAHVIDKELWLTGNKLDMEAFNEYFIPKKTEKEARALQGIRNLEVQRGLTAQPVNVMSPSVATETPVTSTQPAKKPSLVDFYKS